MNKSIIFAIFAVFVLIGSTIAVSALNVNLNSNQKATGTIQLRDGEEDDNPSLGDILEGSERDGLNSGSDDDLLSTRMGIRHYNELTAEQKEKLKSLTKTQLEALVKARLSKDALSNVSNSGEGRTKAIGHLRAHLLKELSEKQENLNKLSKLEEHRIKELNNFTRAEAKAIIENNSEAELEDFDFVKERIENEEFARAHLTKRIVKDADSISNLLENVEVKIDASTEAHAIARTAFNEQKLKWNECKESGETETTECMEHKNKFKERTIEWLTKAVDHLLNKLERLEAKVNESENLSEEEAKATIEQIDALTVTLTKAKADIALLTKDSTGEEIAAQAKIVSNAWIKVQLLDKRIVGELIGRHAGEIIVRAEQLEEKLNGLLERLDESGETIEGLDELIQEFSQNILNAKTHYKNAQGFWAQIDVILIGTSNTTIDVSDLVKKAHEELRLAHQNLKDAHNVLKEIYKLVKENKHDLKDSREPFFQPGKELGYFIWQDSSNNAWICWNSDGETHSVEGTITSSTDFCSVKPKLYEFSTDKYEMVDDKTISFSAHIKPSMDCLQIRTQGNSLHFDLKMDGETATQIFVTKDKTHQTTNPFDWSIIPATSCAVKETFEETCQVSPSTGAQLQICGADGKNYDSACEAHKAGTKVAFNHPCKSCNPDSGEICASNNHTYSSECALPSGITKISVGACAITKVTIETETETGATA
ncbi:MAG: Kazal-type serine protease inhibitor domain-containing protein [archaeon]|nr:Kazal-type serine protease inhibitor domain-containing protein [archaeon]